MTKFNKSPPEWAIGPWKILNPHLTVKLGFVFDTYKLPQLSKLWVVAEEEAKSRLGTFNNKDLFHQEEAELEPGVMISTRWYTPENNRVKKRDGMT